MSEPKVKSLQFTSKVEAELTEFTNTHNIGAAASRAGGKASLHAIRAVYRRGATAYNCSNVKGLTRHEYAMKRVKAFSTLLRKGAPVNPNYTQDNDLLPKAHPKSLKGELAAFNSDILQVALKNASDYTSTEHAIHIMAEYSDLSYDIIPALRGAWIRAIRDGEAPFERAYSLATKLYDSKDADLLMKKRKTSKA